MKLLKTFIFCLSSILFSLHGQAQDSTINGKVIDEKGLPIPGATILLKGTTNSVSTDFSGEFKMMAPKDGTLTISFMGYKTIQEVLNGRTQIQVQLRTLTNELNEVVVVGYGTQKKKLVTGAISNIKGKDLEDLPLIRIEQTLQGRVSGVMVAANSGEPGSSSTIRIRGITSLGNNDPLWVIDGVIVDNGGIGYLTQSDVESIEVLKDAASQAIYGARAAAGVILVTTKKGKSGSMHVNFNSYFGTSAPSKKLKLLNATQYAVISNEAHAAANQPILFPNISELGVGTDWQSAIFNDNAVRFGNDISLSGGNDISTFYLSLGLLDQEGIVATDISNAKRRNIRLNSTHKLSPFVTFGQTLAYSKSVTKGSGGSNNLYGGPLGSAINLDPLTPLVEKDPILASQSPYNNVGVLRDAAGNPYGISSLVLGEMANPLATIQSRLGNYSWSDNIVGNAYLEILPIKGLKLRSTVAGKLAFWGSEGFTPIYYFNSSSINPINKIERHESKGFGWNIENIASYTKNISNHNFSLLLGQGTYVDNITSGLGVSYEDIPADNYQDASFNYGAQKDKIDGYANTGNEHIVTSLFSRLNYDFKEKYLVSGIIRRDGSSRFGSNNKYATFPSFSLGWVVSKEDFWKENTIVNQLKIRGSYGETGSDAIGDFKYLATVSGGRNYTLGSSGVVSDGFSPDAPSNPDLKWEQTSQANIGFDVRLFTDFNVSFDLYNKKTTGILQGIALPGYIGSEGGPTGNVADMSNKGYDLEFGYKKEIGTFNLSVSGNVSYLKNEVTYLGRGVTSLSDNASFQANNYDIIRTEIGQPINSFYGFQTAGIFQNKAEIDAYTNSSGGLIQPDAVPGDFRWKDNNGDGKITEKDRAFLGSSLPKYTFGLTVNLDYKNFDLLVFAQGATGNKIFQGLNRPDIVNANSTTKVLSRWTGEGTSNTYPRVTNNDTNNNFKNPSDFFLEDGNYIRFKTIQFGYSLPKDIINRIRLSKIRLYLTGENLFTLTKYSGFDPEIGGGVMGIDKGYYPQAKTYMLGINVQY